MTLVTFLIIVNLILFETVCQPEEPTFYKRNPLVFSEEHEIFTPRGTWRGCRCPRKPDPHCSTSGRTYANLCQLECDKTEFPKCHGPCPCTVKTYTSGRFKLGVYPDEPDQVPPPSPLHDDTDGEK